MNRLPPKRPTEAVRYVFDLTRQLGDDEITSFTLVVTAGAVTINSSDQPSTTTVEAVIGGGVDGATSTLELTVITDAGQTLIRDYSLLTAVATNANLLSTTTKGQIEDMAFEEIGLAGYNLDATSAEQASGLQRLDALMAQWAGPGMNIDLGYNFPASIGGSSRSDQSGIPDVALDAVVIKLALSIAPGIGKNLSVETKTRMTESMRTVRAMFAQIPFTPLPWWTPRGAGAKPWGTWRPFVGSVGDINGDDDV
jgi:hypothetical protein